MTTHREHRRGQPRRVDLLHSRQVHHEQRSEELLVVADGTANERGVLSIAELLSRRDRINAHLLGVQNPAREAPALEPDERADIRAAQQSRLLARTRQLLHGTVGRGAFWSTDAAFGELEAVVAEQVRTGHTRLVLVALSEPGEGRRGAADTLVAIANAVDVPILAVPNHQELLPTRVLVATDFSSASTRAARIAVSVLGPRGHLSLLHVEPPIDYDAMGHPEWRQQSEDGVTRLFDTLRRELDEAAHDSPTLNRRRTSIVKNTVLVRGEPASAILEHAARHRNDLIVVGTRRISAADTTPLGSVSMEVLRAARCAVLLARSSPRL